MPGYRLFQIDAFTSAVFGGNPAAVVPLPAVDPWPSVALMQAIAAENALSETAFIRPAADDPQADESSRWSIRWFTPAVEVDLCGHATLASAHAVLTHLRPNDTGVVFVGDAVGELPVARAVDGQGYRMSLPRRASTPCDPPAGLYAALGAEPQELRAGPMYLAIFDDERSVAALRPTMSGLMDLDRDGVIVTAPASDTFGVDFVSRYFVPAAGIPEDPVTGSAHCQLAPYWGERLQKTRLRAAQISARGGRLACELEPEVVMIEGRCVDYLEGRIQVPDLA